MPQGIKRLQEIVLRPNDAKNCTATSKQNNGKCYEKLKDYRESP